MVQTMLRLGGMWLLTQVAGQDRTCYAGSKCAAHESVLLQSAIRHAQDKQKGFRTSPTVCKAVPGLNNGVTDNECQKCATGYEWWPCGGGLCDCDDGSRGSTPAPPSSTSPSQCVATPGLNNGVTDADCVKCATGYQWWPCQGDLCDCSGVPGTTTWPPTTPVPSPSTAPTVAPTVAPTQAPTATTTQAPTQAPTNAPTKAPTPSPTSAPSQLPTPNPTPLPSSGDDTIDRIVESLKSSQSSGVFMYDTGNGWIESDIYTWTDMTKAVQLMATTGVGSARLWTGGNNHIYGLVNIAAFLAQCMQETIQYNACDENNWSDKAVVAGHGGSTYSATSACGQLHQSYQDYTCSAEEDELAGGRMSCEVDPDMEERAYTQAGWYGAPAKLFCAPRTKVPNAPRWDYSAPWCPPADGWGHEAPFPDDVELDEYWAYVRDGGSCKDYDGIKTGGWTFTGEGCVNGSCPGSEAPLFGQPEGRTDVEGCCWWGRGVIQTTGVCNFGKLNYYMGKRAHDEGRNAIYPAIDFCKNPGAICAPGGPGELKWVAGFFYWLNAVQPYSSGGWSYMAELQRWVDAGMNTQDTSFIDGASGIVNRGCHNPPNCGTGELHAASARVANFKKVLAAMGL